MFKPKKDKNIPPDIGAEDSFEHQISKQEAAARVASKASIEPQKVAIKLEIISNLVKDYSARFTQIGEQIGEIREMAIMNEKTLSSSEQKASVALELVNQVKPDKLRADYQKLEFKIAAITDKLVTYKQFADSVLNELKDMRKKMGVFIGTDGLLQLNEEVKENIIDIQKIAVKVKAHADKSERIFIDIQKDAVKNEGICQTIKDLSSSVAELDKKVNKLDFSSMPKRSQVDEVNEGLSDLKDAITELSKEKVDNGRFLKIINPLVALVKENKRRINDLNKQMGNP